VLPSAADGDPCLKPMQLHRRLDVAFRHNQTAARTLTAAPTSLARPPGTTVHLRAGAGPAPGMFFDATSSRAPGVCATSPSPDRSFSRRLFKRIQG